MTKEKLAEEIDAVLKNPPTDPNKARQEFSSKLAEKINNFVVEQIDSRLSGVSRQIESNSTSLAIVKNSLLAIDFSALGSSGGSGGSSSGDAGGDLTGTYPNPTIANGVITSDKVNSTYIDGAAAVPSLRTLGTGANQAMPGNTTGLPSTPSGAAGGDLTGTYPNPTVANLAITAAKIASNTITAGKIASSTITDVQIAAANKDGTATTPSMRTLGTGSNQAMSGDNYGVIWKWNETDVSQFTLVHDTIGAGNTSISYDPGTGSFDYSPKFVVKFPVKNTGSGFGTVFTINDLNLPIETGPSGSYRSRYTVVFRVSRFDGTISQFFGVGTAILANAGSGSTFSCMGHIGNNSAATSRVFKVESGSWTVAAGTTTGQGLSIGVLSQSYKQISDVMFQHSASSNPRFRVHATGENATSNVVVFGTTDANFYATALNGGSSTDFGPGILSASFNRVGIVIAGGSGATTNQSWEFDQFYILKHPSKMV